MPLRKIADLPKRCPDPQHNPLMHQHLEPGEYEWECPACGARQRLRVNDPPRVWRHQGEVIRKRMCDLQPGEVCVQGHGQEFVALGNGEWRWLDRDHSEGVARNQHTEYTVVGYLSSGRRESSK
jgi:hypothetical protein